MLVTSRIQEPCRVSSLEQRRLLSPRKLRGVWQLCVRSQGQKTQYLSAYVTLCNQIRLFPVTVASYAFGVSPNFPLCLGRKPVSLRVPLFTARLAGRLGEAPQLRAHVQQQRFRRLDLRVPPESPGSDLQGWAGAVPAAAGVPGHRLA